MHQIAKQLNPGIHLFNKKKKKTFTAACYRTCALLGTEEIKIWNMPSKSVWAMALCHIAQISDRRNKMVVEIATNNNNNLFPYNLHFHLRSLWGSREQGINLVFCP